MTSEKRFNQLVRIEKHPHYYVNPASKKITYRRTHKGETTTIRTGMTAIGKAKEVVELELEKRRSGASEFSIRRRMAGEINPNIGDVWIDEVLPQKSLGKAEATRKKYATSFAHGFGPFWKDRQCSELTAANIFKFKEWYMRTQPGRHCHHTLIHFKMLVDFIVREKYLSAPPDLSILDDLPAMVEAHAKRPEVGRVYTDDEVGALLAVHEKLSNGTPSTQLTKQEIARATRLKVGIRLGMRGLRKMEALSLKRQNIDFSKKVMTVWSSKNSNWREVPMTDDLALSIKEQISIAPKSAWLFPLDSDSERHISGQVFDKVWFKGRALAGIKPRYRGDARFHDLRHTFATWTAEQGWPPRVACAVLDMSLVIYSRVYAKPRFQSKAEWMEKMFSGVVSE